MLTSAVLEARISAGSQATTYTDRQIQLPVAPQSISPFAPLEIANDNPRTLEEELFARLAAAQRELSLVAMHLTADFRHGALCQLRQLLDIETWDKDDAHLDIASFRSFARAMAVLRPGVRPMLGLSSRGHTLAMWGSETMRLSFEHLAQDEVRWSIYLKDEDGRDVAAGTTSISRISRILDAHGVRELLNGGQ
jgi:hypothetical protein